MRACWARKPLLNSLPGMKAERRTRRRGSSEPRCSTSSINAIGTCKDMLPKPTSQRYGPSSVSTRSSKWGQRRFGFRWNLPAHTREQSRHFEAKQLERRCEQCVLFETISAALLMNEFFVGSRPMIRIPRPSSTSRFSKRNGAGMQTMDRSQIREGGRARTIMADTGKVGVQIDHGFNLAPLQNGAGAD